MEEADIRRERNHGVQSEQQKAVAFHASAIRTQSIRAGGHARAVKEAGKSTYRAFARVCAFRGLHHPGKVIDPGRAHIWKERREVSQVEGEMTDRYFHLFRVMPAELSRFVARMHVDFNP